jgi:hypothetical protein
MHRVRTIRRSGFKTARLEQAIYLPLWRRLVYQHDHKMQHNCYRYKIMNTPRSSNGISTGPLEQIKAFDLTCHILSPRNTNRRHNPMQSTIICLYLSTLIRLLPSYNVVLVTGSDWVRTCLETHLPRSGCTMFASLHYVFDCASLSLLNNSSSVSIPSYS